MSRQTSISTENTFVKGLITESTGLSFPENACTETFDCVFGRTGIVSRRLGFNYELNYVLSDINTVLGKAVSNYLWKNVIGDGEVSIVVVQIGNTLHFYRISSATPASPFSAQKLPSTITLTDFLATGATSFDVTTECQYTDGNGYLFVFHKDIDPVSVSYSGGVLTGSAITVKIRDFDGVVEAGVEDTYRPATLTVSHLYNLINQGWGKNWIGISASSNTIGTGSKTFVLGSAGLPIQVGDRVRIDESTAFNVNFMSGLVTSYSGLTLVVNVLTSSGAGTHSDWSIQPDPPLIGLWAVSLGNNPSNSDVWWYFKNASGVFTPTSTIINNVGTVGGPAPKGYFVLDAFNQQRDTISGISIPDVTSGGLRPTTGCWFQGRIWYTGVNTSGFNENLYFSQIIENSTQFGKCYQVNDPTSEQRADLLASDGGVFKIQGTGAIYKLFPLVNGLLVFAERGVWFVTGSQGIGFTATDFTVTPISSIPTISSTSFVDVQGFPMWCNEDGIYSITPGSSGGMGNTAYQGLSVTPITYGTIASFYQDIPHKSKQYIRGFFDYLDYKVQWLYKDTEETDVSSRYQYSNILNFDLITKAFYPWTISKPDSRFIHGVLAFRSPSIPYGFRYLSSDVSHITFSEERETIYKDWGSTDYLSYFVTGYKLHGDAIRKFQSNYIQLYFKNDIASSLDLQTIWDFSTTGNTGRWSPLQRVTTLGSDYGYQTHRLKTRGHGKAFQYKVKSVTGQPFQVIGWACLESSNASP